jgi:hypothetical protein
VAPARPIAARRLREALRALPDLGRALGPRRSPGAARRATSARSATGSPKARRIHDCPAASSATSPRCSPTCCPHLAGTAR